MIGNLKPYPSYGDSGVEWLGRVPEHWQVRSLGSLTSAVSERNRPHLPLLSVVREKGVILRSSMAEDENHNFIPDDLSNYKVVRKGDLVINTMKAWQGSLGVSASDGIVSPAYYVFRLDFARREYAHMLLRSRPYIGFFARASDGVRIGQWDLSIGGMKRIPVVIPPADEQANIVLFLDHVDRQIRLYIRAKQKLIKLLEEQKQAIIHNAVTRGLNPDVRLKPSGVEWLGEVPEHWETVMLGRLIQLTTGFPFKSEGFTQDPEDVPLLRGINISPGAIRWESVVYWPKSEFDQYSGFHLYAGDIVLGMDRPTVSGGTRVAAVSEEDTPALLLQRVARIRPKDGILNDFMLLLLRAKGFSEYIRPIFTGVSVPHLSPEQIRSFRIAIPPVAEQREIVAWLARATVELDGTLRAARREIALLGEYRTRLIDDVVTGKLDVRSAAATLPLNDLASAEPPELDDELEDGEDEVHQFAAELVEVEV